MNEYYGVEMMKKVIKEQDENLKEQEKQLQKQQEAQEEADRIDARVTRSQEIGASSFAKQLNEPSKQRELIIAEQTLARSLALKEKIKAKEEPKQEPNVNVKANNSKKAKLPMARKQKEMA